MLFNIFCIYYVTCCLQTHSLSAVCLCFEFRHLTKQIPTLYITHLLLLLIQHGDIESNLGPKNKQVNSLSCCNWNVNKLLAQNLSKIFQIEAYNSLSSHDFICISDTYFDSTILGDKSVHLNGYNLYRHRHMENRGVQQSHASSLNSDAIDVQKVTCRLPSRCVVACDDYSF